MDKDFYHSFAFEQILRDAIEYRCIRQIFNAGYREGIRDAEVASVQEQLGIKDRPNTNNKRTKRTFHD